MKVALIIVTKDRPDDIKLCLESVATVQPGFEQVVIVDSSDLAEPKARIEEFADTLPITYTHSEPGITKQRNIARGLVADTIDIVLYIDDDVRLPSTTVEQMVAFFEQHSDAIGMTGRVNGEAPHSGFKRLVGGLTFMYTPKPFGFTKGLFNIINDAAKTQEIDWLPGAFMAYRWSAVEHIEFDEWFTTYGLGEDFDFSYRVGMKGHLYLNADVTVQHDHSDVGRNWKRFGYMRVVNRAYLRKKLFPGQFRYWYGYWVATKSMLLFNAVRGIFSKRYRDEFVGNIRGILSGGSS